MRVKPCWVERFELEYSILRLKKDAARVVRRLFAYSIRRRPFAAHEEI